MSPAYSTTYKTPKAVGLATMIMFKVEVEE
jgi:hypothetical protein